MAKPSTHSEYLTVEVALSDYIAALFAPVCHLDPKICKNIGGGRGAQNSPLNPAAISATLKSAEAEVT